MNYTRICCRLPKSMIKKVDEIDDGARSHKIREAIQEYCAKQMDIYLNKIQEKKL